MAAVAGDQVGYLFGQRVGPALFRRPNTRFFKQANVEKAQAFFDKHGAKTIVLARFVPDRPHVHADRGRRQQHGVPHLRRFNVIGGALWAFGVTLLGYFLGQVDVIEENLELAILCLVAISIAPMVIEVIRARRHAKGATGRDRLDRRARRRHGRRRPGPERATRGSAADHSFGLDLDPPAGVEEAGDDQAGAGGADVRRTPRRGPWRPPGSRRRRP